MNTADIKRDLIVLGIDPSDHRVLKLLPLVYVVWVDGRMEEVERERVRVPQHSLRRRRGERG